jgi:hypothetical protein
MGTKTYTIQSNGDGSFSVQVSDGERADPTFVRGFKSDNAAETWARNHKNDEDRLVWE